MQWKYLQKWTFFIYPFLFRVSFPSSHASVAMFAAVYLALYIHYIFNKKYVLVKALFQTGFLCISLYVCFSRISDYAHHWYDVLAGAILGCAGSLYTVS